MRAWTLFLTLLTACGGVDASSSPSSPAPSDPGPTPSTPEVGSTLGQLRVAMTASRPSTGPVPADGLTRVVVSVAEVRIHRAGGGWETISTTTVSVDLLQLEGSSEDLGLTSIDTSSVGQIRLRIEEGSTSYVTTPDGEMHPLKTPSGEQSGLKVKGPFHVSECTDTLVLVDVDLGKSLHIVRTGRDDRYILRPVIRTSSTSRERDDCDPGNEDPGGEDPGNGF